MDPQANAVEQIRLATNLLIPLGTDDDIYNDTVTLAQMVLALAEWQANGGFVPDWTAALASID